MEEGEDGHEKDKEEMLGKVLDNIQLKEGARDCWRWVNALDGRYVVKLAYEFLASTDCVLEDQLCKLIWCKLVPSKVAFFGWRLYLDRLPTKRNPKKHRMQF